MGRGRADQRTVIGGTVSFWRGVAVMTKLTYRGHYRVRVEPCMVMGQSKGLHFSALNVWSLQGDISFVVWCTWRHESPKESVAFFLRSFWIPLNSFFKRILETLGWYMILNVNKRWSKLRNELDASSEITMDWRPFVLVHIYIKSV